jgi:uncharacterized protein with HEPN domain
MSNNDYKIYVIHALEAICRIEFYAQNGKNKFMSSILIQDAIYKNFEVIGEAFNKIDLNIRQKFPEIPWRKPIDMRNYIIHNYDGVDPKKIWKTIEVNIPPLKEDLIKLIPDWQEIEKNIKSNLK